MRQADHGGIGPAGPAPVRLSARSHFWVLVAVLAIFSGCSPRMAIRAPDGIAKAPRSVGADDSLQYRIVFADKGARDRFAGAVDRFCSDQHLALQRLDSSGRRVRIAGEGSGTPPAAPGHPAAAAPKKSAPAARQCIAADSGHPFTGGTLRLYYPRSTLEYPFSGLVERCPFPERTGPDSLRGFFTVQSVSPLSVTLKMSGKTVNADGRPVNALDIVDQWTRFVREHPAEGLALFRSCDGIMDFINGREAVVRGLVPVDNATIRLRLAFPDGQALDRLRSCRALPASLRVGSYARRSTGEGGDTLASNRLTAGTHPLVNSVVVRRGGDVNPLLSFSLGRYDAVALWSTSDLEYARRTLLKNGAACSPLGSDRYFLACRLPDSSSRAFIRSIVAPASLLKDAVKAEGSPIAAVESDATAPVVPLNATDVSHPLPVAGPLKIWCRQDDAISRIIADKLLVSCVRAGVQGKVVPLEPRDYESMLVSGEGCIVAWTGEGVLTDRSERLRLSSAYFNDMADESVRLRENREIPLFTANWYLLTGGRLGVAGGKIPGIYVKPDSNAEQK
jgi:hypothetical protein